MKTDTEKILNLIKEGYEIKGLSLDNSKWAMGEKENLALSLYKALADEDSWEDFIGSNWLALGFSAEYAALNFSNSPISDELIQIERRYDEDETMTDAEHDSAIAALYARYAA